MGSQKYIVLFDGECNLCNGWVRFLKKRDKKRRFELVPIQSDKGTALLGPLNDEALQTVVLLHNQRRFERSDAAIEIVRGLGGGWKLLGLAKWIPRKLRDAVYDFIARHRTQWFGKPTTCKVKYP